MGENHTRHGSTVALKTMTGAGSSTSTAALGILMSLETFHITLKHWADKGFARKERVGYRYVAH